MMYNGFLGAYVPLTMEGTIMVDGVLASCYPSADHDLAHIGMTPIRWFPGMVEWIFGNDDGWQVYTKISRNVGRFAFPTDIKSIYL